VSREAVNQYMNQHGGAIVCILADMEKGFPNMAHTGAARAGVANLCKTAAVEWARYNIRINAVHPGFIETPLNAAPEFPGNDPDIRLWECPSLARKQYYPRSWRIPADAAKRHR